jgi:hypothetical protein
VTVLLPAAGSPTAEVFSQHEHLRGLLRMLDGDAERVVRAETTPRTDLPEVFALVARALSGHLDFEEALLTAGRAAEPARGRPPLAVLARLCEEHARQREELARLSREARGADDRITLALDVRAFIADLLLDMEIEDRAFGAHGATMNIVQGEKT